MDLSVHLTDGGAMDRPIEDHEIRARRLRRGSVAAGGLVLLLCVPFGLRWWLQPHVDADRIRIGVVERGPVEAAILCSGSVGPGNEQVIPSPFEARVRRVLEQPGTSLEAGRAVLELDDTQARKCRHIDKTLQAIEGFE